MRLSYKYRVYLNKEQELEFEKTLNFCRTLYNSALQERRTHYKSFTVNFPNHKEDGIKYSGPTKSTQIKSLKEVKLDFEPQVQNIYSQCLQDVINRLDKAFLSFFDRCKKGGAPGYPRFKTPERYNSITFTQCDFDQFGVRLLEDHKHINIYGLGKVKIKYHRPFEGKCKLVTLLRKGDKYYVCLSCDGVPNKPLPKTGKAVGIDLGIVNFATCDDGQIHHHPKPYKTAKEKLAYHQKKLALKQKGSNNSKRQKKVIANCHEKVANIRKDYLHKFALNIVSNYDNITMEDLNIKSMLESDNKKVNKSNIQDAGWGMAEDFVSYKAERAGKVFKKEDPTGTSRECSGCGSYKEELSLADRVYECKVCGLKIDRDLNAARNIKRRGVSLVVLDFRSPSL
jgi:putative transposase